jgi:hypothetical protein
MLGLEKLNIHNGQQLSVKSGDFAEKYYSRLEVFKTQPGVNIRKRIELEVTQLGKACQGDACAITVR